MQFRHPEILYFLFLLIIPVIVHLFQLRRFKKQYFTNVKLLQELSQQTRKSSVIKKWLLLATRLLLLAALIIAFAQPFFNAKDFKSKSNEMYIVLDNSFSMQAKGKKGELLKRSIEDLLENIPEEATFSLLTTDGQFWNTDIKSSGRDLQKITYSPSEFRLENLMARVNSRKSSVGKDIIVITDAAGLEQKELSSVPKNANTWFLVPEAEHSGNISIDSVYLNQTLDNFYEIGVRINASGDSEKEVPVAITNNGKLLAKTVVKMESGSKTQLFMLPRADFNGSASVSENGLDYDNEYFFSISAPKKIKVLSIGETADSQFLSRIYTAAEFDYLNLPLGQLDYNQIAKQDAIILNNLKEIPAALTTTLKDFYAKGGNIVLIPSAQSTAESLNAFAGSFGKAQYRNVASQEKLITKIAYTHPLYAGVFERKTDNFQYPKAKSSLTLQTATPAVLQFEDQQPFLSGIGNGVSDLFLFGAPIDRANSNFINSPLVVPTFYNMARNIQRSGVVALTIGRNQSFVVQSNLSKDEILTVKNNEVSFIPVQQALNDKVKMSFTDLPSTAGNYGIFNKESRVADVSFNYPRTESRLQPNVDALSGYTIIDNVSEVFDDIKDNRTNTDLWKIFALLALVFLITELLIQKFVK
ncbi:BatA domain-containing protein [Flavobacterium silvaticum]|uniref:Aerotolerance regulator N-terminal domain-containing protein n=1 Tax=Flavobacterium silvaticum TaxID=1852020 RepID=A0A972JGF4_9FLAO|nr:BatA domain-containing protein [Flavobacterium silvaticum]NMH26805.1 hypothetical protein [Flavobacterium silvaticum]